MKRIHVSPSTVLEFCSKRSNKIILSRYRPSLNNMDTRKEQHDEGDTEQQDAIAPSSFICPLTLTVMKDPVMSRYGQSYERGAILEWLAAGNETCPMTRQPLRMSDLISNPQLRLKIRRWQIENSFDINLVTSYDESDTRRTFGYFFTLPNEPAEDQAERAQDDPDVIVEAGSSERRRRISRRPNTAAPETAGEPRRREKRSGLFGRLLSRRAVAA